MVASARKPIFLDRDGVLNVDVAPYVSRLEQFELFPFTEQALIKLDRAGFDIFVVSNQQGVAKGITTLEVIDAVSDSIQSICRPHGFEIKKFFYCTALSGEDSSWRKPKPGMIFAARDEFQLDLSGAFLIGDKWSDIEAGSLAGLRPLLVGTGVTSIGEENDWKYKPEASFPNLLDAVNWILEDHSPTVQ